MRAYRQLKFVTATLLLLLTALSQIILPHLNRVEIFPAFNWSLFSTASKLDRDFVVQIHDGPKIDERDQKKLYWSVQALGESWRNGDHNDVESRRRHLESRFGIVSFDLSERTIDPIAYVLDGQVVQMTKLAEFEN